MKKKRIYKNGSGEMNIEYDGEYFHITQTLFEVEELTVSVTKDEIEEMLVFAKEITQ